MKVKVLGLNVRETKLKLPGAEIKEKYLVHFAFYESFPFHVQTIERENSCLFLKTLKAFAFQNKKQAYSPIFGGFIKQCYKT